jgi:hypothetical protein
VLYSGMSWLQLNSVVIELHMFRMRPPLPRYDSGRYEVGKDQILQLGLISTSVDLLTRRQSASFYPNTQTFHSGLVSVPSAHPSTHQTQHASVTYLLTLEVIARRQNGIPVHRCSRSEDSRSYQRWDSGVLAHRMHLRGTSAQPGASLVQDTLQSFPFALSFIDMTARLVHRLSRSR